MSGRSGLLIRPQLMAIEPGFKPKPRLVLLPNPWSLFPHGLPPPPHPITSNAFPTRKFFASRASYSLSLNFLIFKMIIKILAMSCCVGLKEIMDVKVIFKL